MYKIFIIVRLYETVFNPNINTNTFNRTEAFYD